MGMQRKSGMTYEEVVDWLLSKATRQGECLVSHLAPNAKGYIPVGIGGRGGEKWRANRLVFHIKCEQLTKHDLVLHSCDNRACINPDHLRKGTAAENTADMLSRGRARNGGKTKVTYAMYLQMLSMRAKGYTNVRIGNTLNLSHETVRGYLNGKFSFPLSAGDENNVRMGLDRIGDV